MGIESNEYNQLLISATTSHRRNEALKQLPNVELFSHPGPNPEPEYSDTTLVAKAKNDYLLSLVKNSLEGKGDDDFNRITPTIVQIISAIARYDDSFSVIAGDSRTETFEENDSGEQSFVSHGKPKDEEELFETFNKMHRTKKAIYQVFAGSQILKYNADYIHPAETRHSQTVNVILRKDALEKLTSEEGLSKYLKAFEEFYSSETYSKNGLPAISIRDLSSGISLPVLMKEKMVEAVGIDGKVFPLNDVSDRLLKQIIYGVGVGYSPQVIDQIFPGAYNFIIDNWDWLKEVVQHVK